MKETPIAVSRSILLPARWPEGGGGSHTVLAGESLLTIARRYRPLDVPLYGFAEAIAAANGLDVSALLIEGRVLALPGAGDGRLGGAGAEDGAPRGWSRATR